MRVLFLTHYFPPEVNAPANRTFEHCREWVRAGHEVHVVTGFPSHPAGVVFPGYRVRWYGREVMDGITVHRVPTFIAPNRGAFRRVLNYLSFVPSAVWRSLRVPRPDVVVATSPQFFTAVAGWIVSGLRRRPWVFELRDLWPDSIVAVGAMRRSLAVRLLERLELRLYRSAARVVTVTRSFIENLAGRGVPREKMVFVPNGVAPEAWAGGNGAAVRERFGIGPEAFVASYVGTVGMAHGIGTVLETARRLEGEGFRFLIVGDGAERETLEARARREGLDGVVFSGLVPRETIPDVLAASDACLVLLRRSALFRTVLPSKMFEAMAAGRPIVLGVEGEAREVLLAAGAGLPIPPEDAEALAGALRRLRDEPELAARLGANGRAFVDREFSRRRQAAVMLEVLLEVAGIPAGDAPDRAGTV